MIDRFPQLKKLIGPLSTEEGSDNDIIDSQQYEDSAKREGVDEQFFQDIKTVRQYISSLSKNNYKTQNLKGKYGKAVQSTQQKLVSEEINEILQQNTKIKSEIKQKLTGIKKKVQKSQQQFPQQPQTKMKKNFYLSLSKQITDILQKQQCYQNQYKLTVKQKIIRQVKLIDHDIDQEKVQQYVDNPKLAQQMLQRKIYGQTSQTLKNRVCDIQSKFKDIQKLQLSVSKCLQLFNQLSVLVFAQGQKIDSIQANVAQANYQVKEGNKKLEDAKKHFQCGMKCKCIAIIVALVILIVIIVVVVAVKK